MDSISFLVPFILFTTSLPSQPLRKAFWHCSQLFPFFGGGGVSSEQVDFSLGMLQREASLPTRPCGSHSRRPGQRDNFKGIWGGLQTSHSTSHIFQGLAYQVTPLYLPPLGTLPNAWLPRLVQNSLFRGSFPSLTDKLKKSHRGQAVLSPLKD